MSDGDIHWRSISKENSTTWYGKTDESHIADPADPLIEPDPGRLHLASPSAESACGGRGCAFTRY